MKTVKLTKQMKAEIVDAETLLVKTKQVVGGGGSRNLIVWALKAYKLGYKKLSIEMVSTCSLEAVEGIMNSIDDANELLNPHGMQIDLK